MYTVHKVVFRCQYLSGIDTDLLLYILPAQLYPKFPSVSIESVVKKHWLRWCFLDRIAVKLCSARIADIVVRDDGT